MRTHTPLAGGRSQGAMGLLVPPRPHKKRGPDRFWSPFLSLHERAHSDVNSNPGSISCRALPVLSAAVLGTDNCVALTNRGDVPSASQKSLDAPSHAEASAQTVRHRCPCAR